MNSCDFFWLAGLLEGDGHFGSYQSHPRIMLHMTDRDTVGRAAELMTGCSNIYCNKRNEANKRWCDTYSITLFGRKAAELMAKLYPFMSERRQGQIQPALASYSKTYCVNLL